MDTSTLFFSIIVLYARLVEGEYGDKANSSVTESVSSTDEVLTEDSSNDLATTSEDGVTIEKAILAAEITPKASYNLVDSPRHREEPTNDLYTSAILEEENEGYSDAKSPDEDSFGNRLNPSGTIDSSLDKDGFKHSSIVSKNSYTNKNQHQDFSHDTNSGWHQNPKPFSASYENSNNVEVIPATVKDLSGGTEHINGAPYNPYAYINDVPRHQPQSSWSPYIPSGNAGYFAKENGANLKLEKERLYQIETAKSYLKQVQLTQEYATKFQALQKSANEQLQNSQWKPITSWENNYIGGSRPSQKYYPKPSVVPRRQAPGVSNFDSQNHRNPSSSFLSTNSNQPSHQVQNSQGWKVPSTSHTRRPTHPYSGPTAFPVILPSGFLADTEEVIQARISHLKAIMNAIKAASLWKDEKALKQWNY